MYKTILTVVLFLLQQHIFSQPLAKAPAVNIPDNLTSSTAGISTYIKEHYAGDTARIQAIFDWVATNINYDIEKFKRKDAVIQPVADVLKTRFAVCRGYADLFNELCSLCNIRTVEVGGYTKQNGIVGNVAHMWVAAELDRKWYLFDPTWAAGYVDGNKFTKRYSTTYYKVTPDIMIQDHMPFDPLYQFLNYTVTNRAFIQGKTAMGIARPEFNFNDSLQQFNLLSAEDKIRSELKRIQKIGIENDVVREQVDYLRKLTENFSSKNIFEQAVNLYMRSVSLFNEYINYKNKQFTPAMEDKQIKMMVDSISYHVNASWNTLTAAMARDEANRQAITKTFRELEKFQNRVNQEREFVTTYLRMGKNERSQLFFRQ